MSEKFRISPQDQDGPHDRPLFEQEVVVFPVSTHRPSKAVSCFLALEWSLDWPWSGRLIGPGVVACCNQIIAAHL